MNISRYRHVIVIPLVWLIGLTLGCQKKGPGGITEEEASAIGDTYLKARNEANLDLLDKIYSPEVVVHDPSQPADIVGLNALKAVYRNTHAAVADLRFSLDEQFAKADKAGWVFTMTGTLTGPFRTPVGELPPTGKTLRASGMVIDRIVDGLILEEWLYFNVLDILQPLGFILIPPSPPPSE